jgi:hypothetical protein
MSTLHAVVFLKRSPLIVVKKGNSSEEGRAEKMNERRLVEKVGCRYGETFVVGLSRKCEQVMHIERGKVPCMDLNWV